MAHEIESIFLARKPAWHGLGTVLPDAPSISEAISAAGLGWTVDRTSLQTSEGEPVPGWYAMRRSSDGRILSVAPDSWRPLQNHEAFDFFLPFVDSGLAELESAGSLRSGELVWVLARIVGGDADVLPGDSVREFVLLSNSHRPGRAVRVRFTSVRVVCANTLRVADAGEEFVRVQHRNGIIAGLDVVREAMDFRRRSFAISIEGYREMAKRALPVDGLRRFVVATFAPSADLDDRKATPRCFESVERHYETAPGQNGIQGTYWGAFNAVASYLDFERSRTSEARLEGSWFGAGSDSSRTIRDRAWNLALTM